MTGLANFGKVARLTPPLQVASAKSDIMVFLDANLDRESMSLSTIDTNLNENIVCVNFPCTTSRTFHNYVFPNPDTLVKVSRVEVFRA